MSMRLVWFCLLGLIPPPIALSATFHLSPDGTGDAPDIQSAIDAASDGDQIVLKAGTYTGWGNRMIDFRGKAITVRGAAPLDPAVVAATIIHVEGAPFGIAFQSGETNDSVLEGITLTGGYQTRMLRCTASGPTIAHCNIINNWLSTGLACGANGPATVLRDCTFRDNDGPACTANGHLQVVRCRIERNGAGIIIQPGGTVQVQQCRIVNNSGQGVFATAGSLSVESSTIACNLSGAILVTLQGNASIRNSILWGKWRATGSGATVSVTYSDVEGGYPGEGNVDVDPRMTIDGHLWPDSPLIGAGDPSHVAAPGETDMEGEARLAGGRLDIGADEYVDSDADGLPDWWEMEHFGSPMAADPTADSDADGTRNALEYLARSNPLSGPKVYYVDPVRGNDAWDGLSTRHTGGHGPKATIAAAVGVAVVPDEVVLLPGTYCDQVWPWSFNGVQGKGITIRSVDPDDPRSVASTVIDNLDPAIHGQSEPNGYIMFIGWEGRDTVLAGLTFRRIGGIRCYFGSAPTIRKCVFSWVHEINIEGNASPLFEDCTFTGCTGEDSDRGAINSRESSPVFRRCVITDNTSRGYGPGLTSHGGHPVLDGCLIARNRDLNWEGRSNSCSGVYLLDCQATIQHCTILGDHPSPVVVEVGNKSPALTPTFRNSIVWGPGGINLWLGTYDPVTLDVAYCDIQGGPAGDGNIDLDPQLSGDGHLQDGSPCIDAGDPAYAAAAGETDGDAQPRVYQGRIDIGADEWTRPGDIDGDGQVCQSDLLTLTLAWGGAAGEPNYRSACDLNHDGAVDVVDLLILLENWSEPCHG